MIFSASHQAITSLFVGEIRIRAGVVGRHNALPKTCKSCQLISSQGDLDQDAHLKHLLSLLILYVLDVRACSVMCIFCLLQIFGFLLVLDGLGYVVGGDGVVIVCHVEAL